MNIVLTSVTPSLTQAWRRFCDDVPGVTIHAGSIFDVDCDAMVSPANSFGFIDGGIDATLPGSWAEASERHQLLYTDRVRNLQHDE